MQSLLAPNFSPSLLHLILHAPSLFAKLQYGYNIEQLGQLPPHDVDSRVFHFLPLLQRRMWGSPLHPSGDIDTGDQNNLNSGSYDSPNERDVPLDLLGTQSDHASRCVVEYAMRGMNNRRSATPKTLRGLEGLRTVDVSGGTRRVTSVQLAQAMNFKSRKLRAQQSQTTETEKVSSLTSLYGIQAR